MYYSRALRERAAVDTIRHGLPPHRDTAALSASEYANLKALIVTRGRPGTHDIGLATGLVARLQQATSTPLPRFDKLKDDLAPEATWPTFEGPAETILIDGWCLGALPPDDSAPMNAIEREDAIGFLRGVGSAALLRYQHFFDAFDQIIYLQAPNFEIVRRWRGEQEEAMLGRAMTAEESAALDRFIMHYERITRAMLAGGHRAGWIVRLDENRNVLGIEKR
jgi:D-glycerate 3-kinase